MLGQDADLRSASPCLVPERRCALRTVNDVRPCAAGPARKKSYLLDALSELTFLLTAFPIVEYGVLIWKEYRYLHLSLTSKLLTLI